MTAQLESAVGLPHYVQTAKNPPPRLRLWTCDYPSREVDYVHAGIADAAEREAARLREINARLIAGVEALFAESAVRPHPPVAWFHATPATAEQLKDAVAFAKESVGSETGSVA